MKKNPSIDDIEHLSRGRSTRSRVGNRGTPHRLTRRERILFDAAKRQGFLKIPSSGTRENVVNVYRLWCEAVGRPYESRSLMPAFQHPAGESTL